MPRLLQARVRRVGRLIQSNRRRHSRTSGEPIIDGLRVTVRHVATLYLQGETILEIAEALSLTEAQVFHGLSYFFDHRDEISALIAQEEQADAGFVQNR